MEFEVGEHVLLNIWDFKMPDGPALCFIVKYVRPYEILHKSNFDVYTLKLLTIFVAHLTFYISKLMLFLCDDQWPNKKQKLWLYLDVIKHMLAIKIESILCVKQTQILNEKNTIKWKPCNQKERVLKTQHIDCLQRTQASMFSWNAHIQCRLLKTQHTIHLLTLSDEHHEIKDLQTFSSYTAAEHDFDGSISCLTHSHRC
jgi:hypothetical protein